MSNFVYNSPALTPLLHSIRETMIVPHTDTNPAVVRPKQTCNTFETCTNEEFKAALFHTQIKDIAPRVVSFPGNPAKGSWSAKRFTRQVLPPENDNYFTLGSFKADANGYFRRTKENFVGVQAIMRDEVGTKSPIGAH